MIDKGVCDKGFIWNPSNSECECDKLNDIDKYLDYENCKCRKKLVYKQFEERTENVKLFTIYVVIIAIVFKTCIGIGACFVYSH